MAVVLGIAVPAALGQDGETIFIEAESFADRGGWIIDQQSMDVMGSAFIMAHGLGVPVADARTSIEVPRKGDYRLWVRTRDWVATWGLKAAPAGFSCWSTANQWTWSLELKGPRGIGRGAAKCTWA